MTTMMTMVTLRPFSRVMKLLLHFVLTAPRLASPLGLVSFCCLARP